MADDEATLIEYLLGLLGPAESAAVAARCRSDSALASKLAALDGSIHRVADAHSVQPGAGLRARLMQSLDKDHRFGGFLPRVCHFLDLSESEADGVLALAAQVPSEVPQPFAGVHSQTLKLGPRRGGRDGSLIWLAPAAQIPRHTHRGAEWGLVLQGRIIDDAGADQTVGDYVHAEAGSTHTVTNPGAETAIVLNLIEQGYQWETEV